MRATGFTHVSIGARDVEESARFYKDFFGMEEVPSPDFSGPVRWLRVGGLQLHLFLDERPAPARHHFAPDGRGLGGGGARLPRLRDGRPAPARHHFALDVDDFEEAYKKAGELDVRDGDRYST